jgi:predicted HicB family RNase H-like nuclease
MASTIPPILVQLQADISGLKKGLADAEKAIKGVDNNVKTANVGVNNFTSSIKKLGLVAGVTFGTSQIVNFFRSAVSESTKAEAAQARLANLLRNTNGATEEQITALGKQAQALEQVGVVSAGNITVAQSQLATFDLTAASIATLTPAILNYVTAEKGATATTDEFKQMTNGLAQAMQGNFASLTKTGFVLDAATKATIANGTEMERSRAVVEVLNSTYKDFNENLRKTSQGAMQVAINDFNDLKEKIGRELVPVISQFVGTLTSRVIPALTKLVDFLVKNKDSIMAVTKVLIAGAAAYATYRTAMIVATASATAFRVAMVLMKGAQLASIASTNGLAASILVMNAAMRANPIGVVITALTLLAAAFMVAWKNSETFRKAVIKGLQVVINGFGYLVGAIGSLLSAASKIPGIGDKFKGPAEAVNKTANDIRAFSDGLDKLATKKIEITANVKTTVDNKNVRTGDEIKISDKEAKARAKAAADAAKKRLREVESARKKLASANEDLVQLEEKKLNLIADYEKDVAKRRLKYDEDVVDAKIESNKKLLDIEKNYLKQIDDAQKVAAQRRKEIIKQSIDGLRDVFKSATALDVGKMFADLLKGEDPTQATSGTLVDRFKQQLSDIKTLAANATALSNQGFSQTFVEQVVAQGTEVGNKLAEEILKATPETVGQLQSLFTEIQDTSAHGVDLLATTMYEKLGLATEQLKENYLQVGLDLSESLAQYAADFAEASAQAKADLVETLDNLQKDLNRDLAEMQDSFHVAMAEINKDILSVIASINSLLTLMASLGSGSKTGGGKSIKPQPSKIVSNFDPGSFRLGEANSMINVNISNTNTQSDAQTAASVLAAMKFGQLVEIGQGR